jgi:hypothetical protein
MLKACESFPDGCIIFLDELDSLATSRSAQRSTAQRGAARCSIAQRVDWFHWRFSTGRLWQGKAPTPAVVEITRLVSHGFDDGCNLLLKNQSLQVTLEHRTTHVLQATVVDPVCRGSDMHEATRRLLGVLLRHLDGFDASKRTGEGGAGAGCHLAWVWGAQGLPCLANRGIEKVSCLWLWMLKGYHRVAERCPEF